MNEPPGARARVALTGLTVAEYFRDQEGQDVLLFIDNIFRFTQAGSEVRGDSVQAKCIGIKWIGCVIHRNLLRFTYTVATMYILIGIYMDVHYIFFLIPMMKDNT